MNSPVAIALEHAASYREWRAASKQLLANDISPDRVTFTPAHTTADLFAAQATTLADEKCSSAVKVPRDFPAIAKTVLCHSDDSRFALMYRLLWRLQEEPRLLDNESDEDVWKARRLAKEVRRDAHKMKAFVRFRKIEDEAGEAFIAWFEPEHHIVERTAPFFAKRFAGMRWSIVTPERSAHWDGSTLSFGDGASRGDCPNFDALENHWRVYYSSIFNPARLKVNAMRAEMPVKYWRNLPESRLIPELTRSAQAAQRAAPRGKTPSIKKAQAMVAKQPHAQKPPTGSES